MNMSDIQEIQQLDREMIGCDIANVRTTDVKKEIIGVLLKNGVYLVICSVIKKISDVFSKFSESGRVSTHPTIVTVMDKQAVHFFTALYCM